jgi:tetratricopeptide (TPR) repeat protein
MQRSIRWPLVLVLFALWALPCAVAQNKKAVVYFEKARASAYAKEYGQAVAWTQKALAKDPTYGAAALLKGDLYSVKGPQDSAYSAYRQAFEKHRAGNIALLRWGHHRCFSLPGGSYCRFDRRIQNERLTASSAQRIAQRRPTSPRLQRVDSTATSFPL